MNLSFDGKFVLITGAAGGLGRELARGYAKLGANLLLASRNSRGLDELVSSLSEFGGAYHAFEVDITLSTSVESLFKKIKDVTPYIDVAVNNAGCFSVGDLSEKEFEKVINTNLTGTWRCLNEEIQLMLERGEGSIVNISSLIGRSIAAPGLSAYAASKAGLEALSRTYAKEYISKGIRINTVSPGAFDTNMSLLPGESKEERNKRFAPLIPAGRVGKLKEISDTVIWATSNQASFFVGHDFVVDGGASN